MGLLLAIGFTIGRVRRLLLGEGLIVAVFGAALGVAAGMLYNGGRFCAGLSTVWSGAVGLSDLQAHVTLQTIAIGFASGVFVAIAGDGCDGSTAVVENRLLNFKRPAL